MRKTVDVTVQVTNLAQLQPALVRLGSGFVSIRASEHPRGLLSLGLLAHLLRFGGWGGCQGGLTT